MAIIIWMKVIKLLYLFLGSQILHVCFTICLLYFRDFTTTKTRMKNLFGLLWIVKFGRIQWYDSAIFIGNCNVDLLIAQYVTRGKSVS